MGLRQYMVSRAGNKIAEHVRARYTLERAIPQQGLFNFQCHRNAIQYVLDNPDRLLDVVECIYLDSGEPILHYCIRDRVSGQLLEVTLGWYAEGLEFYAIRVIPPEDHRTILSEFNRSMTYWTNEYVPMWLRVLLCIDRVV